MRRYTVKRGDTLGGIARQAYGSASSYWRIVGVNHIEDPDRLRVGQVLVLPDVPAGVPGAPGNAIGAATTTPGGDPPATEGIATTATAPSVGTAAASPTLSAVSERRLAQLHPAVATRGRRMIQQCADAGVPILVTQGFRSWREQDQLYAIGRTKAPLGRRHVVTNAAGGKSWHNFGLAFDIVVLDAMGKADWNTRHPGWGAAAEIGRRLGLQWGGDWKTFKDLPHFQYTGDLTLAYCRQRFDAGLDGIWSQLA